MSKKGFTLIELLVVVAIIGILAGIVLASLGSARTSAYDAKVKAQLRNMLTAAEVIYNSSGNYDTVCDPTSEAGKLFHNSYAVGGTWGGAGQCLSSGTVGYSGWPPGAAALATKATTPFQWAASIPLRSGTVAAPQYFCVDSTGKAQIQTSRGTDFSPLTVQCN
jgi:prepilin-type N-terminal cleavage/methylation domain-containing protein